MAAPHSTASSAPRVMMKNNRRSITTKRANPSRSLAATW